MGGELGSLGVFGYLAVSLPARTKKGWILMTQFLKPTRIALNCIHLRLELHVNILKLICRGLDDECKLPGFKIVMKQLAR